MVHGEIFLETKSKKFNVLMTFLRSIFLSGLISVNISYIKITLEKVLWNLNDRVKEFIFSS